jgi:hypothetical protein
MIGAARGIFVNLPGKNKTNACHAHTRPISQEQIRDRVPDELRTASHVFIRRDSHVPPLAQLYEGPFQVVSKDEKVYHVQCGPRSKVISVDRLKAYVGRDEPEVAHGVVPRSLLMISLNFVMCKWFSLG